MSEIEEVLVCDAHIEEVRDEDGAVPCVHCERDAARRERDEAIRVLADLVELAKFTMHEANNLGVLTFVDGGEFDADEELAEARKILARAAEGGKG